MKALKHFFIITILIIPTVGFSQTQNVTKTKTSKRVTVMDTSKRVNLSKDPVIKENAPVLNDNGNVNTNGTIDGSRSSTGRPGADTTAGYTVRRRKRTITTGGVVYPDTTTVKKP
ncbi:hypothetical protein [Dyadobacter frigoris]|uniref:Uncharacterized protein n=1 Tax=Dyadobacter frigoris TaxID=2576211 RepID=A0A4U6D9P7_9BACT|nr:hypothetical protein [Dyadobacter frigoris]TKT93017.1 hypothetical protein FDK13_03940 [Dyadobacter frigoris]GLU55887.1 hypothetical protein Dfri01_53480 [Dyadobacter frigoris]